MVPTVTGPGAGRLDAAAVVDRAALDRRLARAGGVQLYDPALAAGGRVPGRAAVDRNLDAADPAAGVGGGAGDRDGVPAATSRLGRGR